MSGFYSATYEKQSGRHLSLTCIDHPELRWSTKDIPGRTLSFNGKYSGELHTDKSGTVCDSSVAECTCPESSLVRAPEDTIIAEAAAEAAARGAVKMTPLVCELCPSLDSIDGKIAHIVQHRKNTPGLSLSFMIHVVHDARFTFDEAVVKRIEDRKDRAEQYRVGIIPRG